MLYHSIFVNISRLSSDAAAIQGVSELVLIEQGVVHFPKNISYPSGLSCFVLLLIAGVALFLAHQMSGSRLGAMTQAIFSILLAVLSGLVHQWKLGLVGSLFVPLVLAASWSYGKIIASHGVLEEDSVQTGAKVRIRSRVHERKHFLADSDILGCGS